VAEQRVLAKELQEKSHEYCRCGSEIEIGDDATGQLGEVKKEIARFNKILLANPRDLQVLGECPGRKPHLAFNDYRTNPEARTHLVELYKDTILANARFCGGDLSRSPRFALTQGPADIMEARQLLMLVSGEHKAEAVHSTFISNLGIEDLEEASARNIRLHDDVIVAMDMPAAKYIMGDLEKIKRSYDRMKKNCKIEVW
jgi:glucosamine-6-phosphate deaminase